MDKYEYPKLYFYCDGKFLSKFKACAVSRVGESWHDA